MERAVIKSPVWSQRNAIFHVLLSNFAWPYRETWTHLGLPRAACYSPAKIDHLNLRNEVNGLLNK